MKNSLFLILILNIHIIFAQKSVKIEYEQKMLYSESFFNQVPELHREGLKKIALKPEKLVLSCNEDYSLFKNENLKEETVKGKGLIAPKTIDAGLVFKPYKNWVLKDYSQKTATVIKTVADKEFYIKKPFEKGEFIFSGKEKVIEGFNCKLAYLIKGQNDTIQYWYTQDIPVIDGPETNISLPGLVLSIESKKKLVYATKIEFFDKPLDLDKIDKNIPFVTIEEYEKQRLEALKPKSFIDATGNKQESHSVTIKRD